MFKTILSTALLGLSLNAFAAVSDISNVTHGSKAGQELKIGGSQPSWSDLSATTQKGAAEESRPFAKSSGNYSFADLSNVTHN